MRTPIKVVRTKYYEHRTEIIAGAAFAAGVATAIYCVKPKEITRIPKELVMYANQPAEELAELMLQTGRIVVDCVPGDHTVSIVATDFVA